MITIFLGIIAVCKIAALVIDIRMLKIHQSNQKLMHTSTVNFIERLDKVERYIYTLKKEMEEKKSK